MARSVVLQRLIDERNQLVDTIESVLAQVEGRDLTDAEQAVLEHTRERIKELDAQIKPLEDYEAVRDAHHDTQRQELGRGAEASEQMIRVPAQPRRVDGGDRAPSTAPPASSSSTSCGPRDHGPGVDPTRSRGPGVRGPVVADQKTADTTGILPTPIVGQVVNLIDANRPLITSPGRGDGVGRDPRLDVHPPEDHPAHHGRRPGRRENPAAVPEDDDQRRCRSRKPPTAAPSTSPARTSTGPARARGTFLSATWPTCTPSRPRRRSRPRSRRRPPHAAVVVATNTLADWTKALYLAAADSYVNSVHDAGPDLVLPGRVGGARRAGRRVPGRFCPDPAPDSWRSAARRWRLSGATSSACPASWSRRSRPGRASSGRRPCTRCTRR